MNNVKKIAYIMFIIIFLSIFLYAFSQIFSYLKESMENQKLVKELTETAVVKNEQPLVSKEEKEDHNSKEATIEQPTAQKKPEITASPIKVDFSLLKKTSNDVKAWLYCENTMINYPVAKGNDNSEYLYKLLNGNYNRAGTLFIEQYNQEDFSDWNTIIYGHNMKNNTMFGTLTDYNDQAYYEEHPIWFLLTPEGDYKIELISGFVTDTSSEIYSIPQSKEEKDALVKSIMKKSTFASNAEISSSDKLITFSTCTYEYDEARYVLIGILKEL